MAMITGLLKSRVFLARAAPNNLFTMSLAENQTPKSLSHNGTNPSLCSLPYSLGMSIYPCTHI